LETLIKEMVSTYDAQTLYDRKNAMKEAMQEMVLCGLSRAEFFNKAAFYGGTALRIFYGLGRFSEDLDFSLLQPDPEFDLATYFPVLEKEVKAFGLHVEIRSREKVKESPIQSAFLKGNTLEHLLLFYPELTTDLAVPKNEIVKIKFEVDVQPPRYATFERKYRLQPVPYEVNLYDEPSLFAGKIHAVLGRSWKNRIKGRDLYDYVFYLAHDVAVNLPHLRERLIQSGHLDVSQECSLAVIKKMLCERFDAMDFAQAQKDVAPFIRDTAVLKLWSADFFKQITEKLQVRA
jgi:predicted nucleotidyltransferase component of viral defense system